MTPEAQLTPDYRSSLRCTGSSVDRSRGPFFPVLPVPADGHCIGTEVLGLDTLEDTLLDAADLRFITLKESPLLDALGTDESGVQQDLHVLAGGGLTHAELLGNQHTADTVFDQVPVDLRREMLARLLQPVQDLQPPVVRQRPQHGFFFHIDN